MASLLDILAWRNISTAVQKVETGIPNRLPSQFFSVKENVLGDRTTYVTFYGQRQTARRGEYGSQSRARTLKQIGEQSVTLLHFPEHVKIRQELLLRLRNPNDLLAQQIAQQEIARHGRDFRQLFDNTRLACINSMLANGKIWFDVSGNVLPTSSGASLTVDYGVGANNLNQLNGNLTVGWQNYATANIIQDIENVRVQMKQNTGRDLKHAFYGKNVPAFLYNNSLANKNYFAFNPTMYQAFQSAPGTIPNGTFGLEWHRMSDVFFEDSSGTVQAQFPGDQVVFTPEIDSNTYTLYEGSIAVPRKLGVETSMDAALGEIDLVYGIGGYAVLEADPVGVKQVYFDTMIPHWKNPLDLFIADVTF
jgi:hypothetical protein